MNSFNNNEEHRYNEDLEYSCRKHAEYYSNTHFRTGIRTCTSRKCQRNVAEDECQGSHQNRAQTKTFSAVARRRIFTFQQSIDGKDISLKWRRRVLSSRIPDFPRHVVSGYHQSSCLAAGSLAVFSFG